MRSFLLATMLALTTGLPTVAAEPYHFCGNMNAAAAPDHVLPTDAPKTVWVLSRPDKNGRTCIVGAYPSDTDSHLYLIDGGTAPTKWYMLQWQNLGPARYYEIHGDRHSAGPKTAQDASRNSRWCVFSFL